ncbi:hypothetical protein PIB30_072197 [Stylosanthes scabra]|uniref:Uncharacterized protein n=1 Tax=Stylosanthes scabra TaxID=79078 RepID=A0ABU6YMW6_9FABA|nr:hypothetical protein [Stylosanthes scabra]
MKPARYYCEVGIGPRFGSPGPGPVAQFDWDRPGLHPVFTQPKGREISSGLKPG